MRIFYISLCFVLLFVSTMGQARLVLNGAYLRLANGTSAANKACLVIDNSSPAAITRTINGGLIISEGEFNTLKWNIGTALPTAPDSSIWWFHLGTSGLNWMPFKLEKTTAGAGSGSFEVSTWFTAANATLPSGGYTVCPSENNAMDRFWVIDDAGYTTTPTCDVWFYYYDDAAERDNIAETDLAVQHGNLSLTCPWDLPSTTTNDATNNFARTNGVSNFSPFTLGNRSSPLPVELISLNGMCRNNKIELRWETASETNNAFFTVERSADGATFESIGTLAGQGNSNEAHVYYFYDDISRNNPNPYYYRLKQTDFDGSFLRSGIITVAPCTEKSAENVSIYQNAEGEIAITVLSSKANYFEVFFYDNLGRQIHTGALQLSEGFNSKTLNTKKLATGIYYVALVNEEEIMTKKVMMH